MSPKPKLSMFWASSCGGCEIALVNLHERILEVCEAFDFFFCPCLLDTKKRDVEALPDRGIAITLCNGAIRTAENEEMARLLRAKSEILLAFGSCAHAGCIPALSNLSTRDEHFRTLFGENVPQLRTTVPEGVLELPEFFSTVKTLAQVVEVDYFIPGCPPEPHQIWNVLESMIQGRPLPPRGSVLGGGRSSVCDECTRTKSEKKIARFHRTFEIVPDAARCLLEQGIVCMGIATRNGCGALCPKVNSPCTGCYGAPEGVADQGAKMLAALGSVLDVGEYKGLSEAGLAERTDAALAGLADPAGTFYKYSLAGSILGGRR